MEQPNNFEKPDLSKDEVKSYATYEAEGGKLSEEKYQNLLECLAEEKGILTNQFSSKAARSMAELASITLAPGTVTIYGILRAGKTGFIEEHYGSMSDQELLAEALRITGDTRSLSVFTEYRETPPIFKQ